MTAGCRCCAATWREVRKSQDCSRGSACIDIYCLRVKHVLTVTWLLASAASNAFDCNVMCAVLCHTVRARSRGEAKARDQLILKSESNQSQSEICFGSSSEPKTSSAVSLASPVLFVRTAQHNTAHSMWQLDEVLQLTRRVSIARCACYMHPAQGLERASKPLNRL